MRPQIRTIAVAAIAASSISQFPHPAVAAVGLRLSVPAFVAGPASIVPANTAGGVLNLRGMHVRIGSAAWKTQALLKAHPNFVLPVHPLFVADPAMNAIVIFNANGSGTQTPSAVLAGPNTQLNGPDSIVEDWDVPCGPTFTSSSCAHFLFVVNAGNNTVLGYRYPLTQANQAPYFTFTVPGSCALAGLGFPAGIEHFHPSAVLIQAISSLATSTRRRTALLKPTKFRRSRALARIARSPKILTRRIRGSRPRAA